MGKIIATTFGAAVGGLVIAVTLMAYLDWGTQGVGQVTHVDPTRADYVDLLLFLVAILLAGIGLMVAVGALVIGVVAFKTLREIKNEAAESARNAAVEEIEEKLYHVVWEMSQKGELDEALERVIGRIQSGGPDAHDDESG